MGWCGTDSSTLIMAQVDYYDILGISKDADEKGITQAYRRLAKKYHPDRNPNDPATEEKFKRVQDAYGVLGDAAKRRQFDQFGSAAVGNVRSGPQGGDVYSWGGGSTVNVDDLEELLSAFGGRSVGGDRAGIYEQIFGGGGRRGVRRAVAQRGGHIEQGVDLSFEQMIFGTTVSVSLSENGQAGKKQTLDIKIPPGVTHGQRIRVKGKGQPGASGGPPGDLYLICTVRPHPRFSRDGFDIHVTASVTVSQAALGGKIDVPTPEGTVTVTLPPGSSGGTKLRLKGRGIAKRGGRGRGDQFVTIRIDIPRTLSEKQRDLFEALRAVEQEDPEEAPVAGKR